MKNPLFPNIIIDIKTIKNYNKCLIITPKNIGNTLSSIFNENIDDPGYYLIRPGALRFLNELSDYFEIVIFTAAMPDVSIIYFFKFNYSMLIGY